MESNSNEFSFYFELLFQEEKIKFQEISGISGEVHTEEFISKSENRFTYKPPTSANNQNLTLQRSIIPANSKFIEWCKDCIDGELSKKIQTQVLSVNLLDTKGEVSMKWTFHNAYPVKWVVSDLLSQKTNSIVESIELAYNYFEVT